MKKIGLICDTKSKKIFLLPNDVRILISKGLEVYFQAGYGSKLNINDNEYTNAGAKLLNSNLEVINQAEVILKVTEFNGNELAKCKNKIAISMANYIVNVEMLYEMLTNDVTGLQWCGLANKSGYIFFPKLEEIKAKKVFDLMIKSFATGLAKKPKEKVTYPAKLKIMILNATFCGVALAQMFLEAGHNVLLLDNDIKYCSQLKASKQISKICAEKGVTFEFDNSNFNTMESYFPKVNGCVCTTIDPTIRAKHRITKEMALSMPAGSIIIDAGCENGYGLNFQKDFVKPQLEFQKLQQIYYCCYPDFSDLESLEASTIISNSSIDYLIELMEKGIKTNNFDNLVICEKGKVVNSYIKTTLQLY